MTQHGFDPQELNDSGTLLLMKAGPADLEQADEAANRGEDAAACAAQDALHLLQRSIALLPLCAANTE